MSTLIIDEIKPKKAKQPIKLSGNVAFGTFPKQFETGQIYTPKSVIQCKHIITEDMSSWYARNRAAPYKDITPLQIKVTPKFKDSKIIIQWMINGEGHQDQGFVVLKNHDYAPAGRNAQSNSDFDGEGLFYQTPSINQSIFYQAPYRLYHPHWSVMTSMLYDQNQDSTGGNWTVQYIDQNINTLEEVVYSVAIQGTSTGDQYFYLNRNYDGDMEDAREKTVSTAVLWEISNG